MNCENCSSLIIEKYGSGRFCSSTCARGFSTKSNREEISKKVSKKLKGIYLNKNRPNTKKITKKCPICSNDFSYYPSENRIYCSLVCYNRDSNMEYRKKVSGGLREKSGRGKFGYYKGVWCNSSYELAWVIWAIDHSIKIERNHEGIDYFYDGKFRKFYPDFLLDDGIYLEIKGFETEQFKAKIRDFKKTLKVLYRKDLNDIFLYVEKKYGDNFTDLYEKGSVNRKDKCINCKTNFVKRRGNKFCGNKCSADYYHKNKWTGSSVD